MSKIIDTWFVVINPFSGSGKTTSQWNIAENLFKAKNIPFKHIIPRSISESADRIMQACKDGYRKFLAVGGDGTVHHMLNAIMQFREDSINVNAPCKLSEFKLAAIPIGSGNDWLRSNNINIKKNLAKAVDLIAAGSFRLQDIVKAEIQHSSDLSGKEDVRYMINVGGYGFDADVCDVVNTQKSKGITSRILYMKAVLRLVLFHKTHRTKITCDGATVYNDYLHSISVGNGKYSGGGICQTPSATNNDGIINLMVYPNCATWKIFPVIGRLLNGRAEKISILRFFSGKEVTITPYGNGELVEIDGEIIGRAPVRLSVIDEQIGALYCDCPQA